MLWRYIVCAIVGYFLGNIETSIFISKKIFKNDIRNAGSGNAGSTNMLRTHGLKAGILTFVGDIAKAVIASLFGLFIGKSGNCTDWCTAIAGMAVIFGHNFPVFFAFKGGKGIASTLGALWVFVPYPVALCGSIVGFSMIYFSKMVSVGSLLGVTTSTVMILLTRGDSIPHVVFAIAIFVLAYVRHSKNIYRIFTGTEKKISVGKSKKDKDVEGKATGNEQ